MAMRTAGCGQLSASNVGQAVELAGWVHRRRDFGKITFVDLRDRTGHVQLVFESDRPGLGDAHTLNREDVLSIRGTVARRTEANVNPEMKTGDIEVRVETLSIENRSKTPPFLIEGDGSDATEETRLRYRYVDLRRERLQRALELRHRTFQATRNYFASRGFLEVETPVLTKSTPEGARDFLVPSRIHRGSVYALPQSPQLFKQLLMVGGLDRYFQLVKCFRDEDLRADRQPEFTQLDLEMSFPRGKDEVFEILEGAVATVFREVLGVDLQTPFPRLAHADAIARFGIDKPDLRFGMEIRDVSTVVRTSSFRVFRDGLAEGGKVAGLLVEGGSNTSRAALDELQSLAVGAGAKGMLWLKLEGDVVSPIAKHLSPEETSGLIAAFGASSGDLVLLLAGRDIERPLGELRLAVARQRNLTSDAWNFLWVTDFPLFELDEEGRLTSAHHPFTAPHAEHIARLETEPLALLSDAYDLVLNGTELGSGSVRIHSRGLQERIFHLLGISPEEAELRFGWFLQGLDYGAPPHAGFALGMDRLTMLMAREASLRDVIAFPKTANGMCPLTEAPMPASEGQMQELGISWRHAA
ncbi:MAG: aspartate--tRNA ligase [Candidatus Bipolaricaulota bacterium]